MNSIIELNNVSKNYGTVPALQKLSLSIHAGEIIGLLGHNGAGKTTTMKLILGLLTASQGEILVFGETPSLHSNMAFRRQTGFLPEIVSFYPHLSGKKILHYFARLKGVAQHKVQTILQQVGLDDAADRKVKTYSNGMRQRLGLAQALLGSPRLLLLDEPTAGLDPTATAEFYCMLDELRQGGTTVILSSHILTGIEDHIDRAVILGDGQLLAAGNLTELRATAALAIHIQFEIQRPEGGYLSRPLNSNLTKRGATIISNTNNVIQLTAPESKKLSLLRYIMTIPELVDISVLPASLDELYAYYNNRSNSYAPHTNCSG